MHDRTRFRPLHAIALLLLLNIAATAVAATDSELLEVDGFPTLVRKPVTFWSDGTRLAGDIFHPKELAAGDRLPAIVLCHGWGGVKAHLNRQIAPQFAAAGYIVLAFDYRGWGESDSRLVVRGDLPEPDAQGEVTVKALAVREVVDPLDQEEDIDAAITFMEGEPHADASRIGIWGSSFGASHVVWRAGQDDRVKAVVSQVGGYSRSDLPEIAAQAKAVHALEIQRVRGEIDPVPMKGNVEQFPELRGVPYPERIAEFLPGDFIEGIKVPVQILQAEKEHYFDPVQHGEWAYKKLQSRGIPAEYHVLKGIGHYDVYTGQPLEEIMKLEIAFFDKHLKKASQR